MQLTILSTAPEKLSALPRPQLFTVSCNHPESIDIEVKIAANQIRIENALCTLPCSSVGQGFHAVGIALLGCDEQRGDTINVGVKIRFGFDQGFHAVGIVHRDSR